MVTEIHHTDEIYDQIYSLYGGTVLSLNLSSEKTCVNRLIVLLGAF